MSSFGNMLNFNFLTLLLLLEYQSRNNQCTVSSLEMFRFDEKDMSHLKYVVVLKEAFYCFYLRKKNLDKICSEKK